jgi:hypothetical protein
MKPARRRRKCDRQSRRWRRRKSLGAGVACSPGVREHLAILAPVTCAQVDNVIARLRSKKTWRWLIVPGKKLAASGKNEELKIPAPQIIHQLSSTAAVRETSTAAVRETPELASG